MHLIICDPTLIYEVLDMRLVDIMIVVATILAAIFMWIYNRIRLFRYCYDDFVLDSFHLNS